MKMKHLDYNYFFGQGDGDEGSIPNIPDEEVPDKDPLDDLDDEDEDDEDEDEDEDEDLV